VRLRTASPELLIRQVRNDFRNLDEFQNGIDGTNIKTRFIKLAFDDGKTPSAIDKKLFSKLTISARD
jgi:hypothetical protein